MGVKSSTGVILHDVGTDTDYSQLAEFFNELPEVEVIWKSEQLPLAHPDELSEQFREHNLERVLVIGNRPGFIKPAVARSMATAGKNPESVMLIDLSPFNIQNGDAALIKGLLLCAILNIPFEAAAQPEEVPVHPDTLVIGGGIAGIQASLEIANGNQKVYLVERTGTIGGHMAMFDKTFPTLDCAACILTPKMVEVGQHPFIELLTLSEVKAVSGSPGNYKVRIIKKARRVDLSTCIACGICAEKCPATAPSEFDAQTTMRKAIYIPFQQAVPNKYLIDPDSCIYLERGKCGVCVKVCPADCINLDEKDEEIEITVGNIIVATGFKTFDAQRAEQFGYGKYINVVTSLEFERLINAAGPTGGDIKFRAKDKRGNLVFSPENDVPGSVAIIHCIGSRDENYNKYCSKVCCMYSLKLAHLVREKLPDAEVFEYYIDMRSFGKGYEEFYERIKEEGIHIIRGRTAKVEQVNGQLKLRTEDIENNRLVEQNVDMVILAVGLEPREDARALAKMLGINQSEDGWFSERDYNGDPINTLTGGIFIAGVCQGPKDIPDTVAQASAAASCVLQSISKGKTQNSIKTLTFEAIEYKANELYAIKEDML
jgi:heterodisulfide reductase subunit A